MTNDTIEEWLQRLTELEEKHLHSIGAVDAHKLLALVRLYREQLSRAEILLKSTAATLDNLNCMLEKEN